MALDWKKAKSKTYTDKWTILDQKRKDSEASMWLAINDKKIEKKAVKKLKRKKNAYRQQSVKHSNSTHASGVIVYTDGACEPNPGKGGWAFVVYDNGTEIHAESCGESRSTNNIMEMTAVLRALEWLRDNGYSSDVTIYSDSQYVVKGCMLWRHGWRKKGWHRSSGGEVANVDLWKELSAILDKMKTRIEWCKGHAGIIGNERADELSVEGRLNASRPDPLIVEQLSYSI
jgi:ribonuclease HI